MTNSDRVSLRSALREAFAIYPKLFRYWPLLAAVHLAGFLSSEIAISQQEEVLQSGRENLPAIFMVFAGSAVVDILFATAWIVAVVHTIQAVLNNGSVAPDILKNLNAALIESVRALARSLRWLPVLIIPAVVKFVRLTFVPFIVADQAAYKEGAIDALNESERITKRRFWLILIALLLCAALPGIPALLLHAEHISLASRPGLSITWSVFEFFTSLLATAFLFCLYRQLVSQQSNS